MHGETVEQYATEDRTPTESGSSAETVSIDSVDTFFVAILYLAGMPATSQRSFSYLMFFAPEEQHVYRRASI